MNKCAKRAVRFAEANGYRFERRNAKTFLYYRHPESGHEVGIKPSGDENNYRWVVQNIERACGLDRESNKRNPQQIKEREARIREELARERARHAARLEELTREKRQLLLAGAGARLGLQRVREIERLIEDEDRHHREVVRQMTAVPAATPDEAA